MVWHIWYDVSMSLVISTTNVPLELEFSMWVAYRVRTCLLQREDVDLLLDQNTSWGWQWKAAPILNTLVRSPVDEMLENSCNSLPWWRCEPRQVWFLFRFDLLMCFPLHLQLSRMVLEWKLIIWVWFSNLELFDHVMWCQFFTDEIDLKNLYVSSRMGDPGELSPILSNASRSDSWKSYETLISEILVVYFRKTVWRAYADR